MLGNYVILDKLGQGGMGLVLKAEHRRMERMVALKILSPAIVQSPDAVRRFQREVKAAARLTHPNIVIAHDADEAGGTHFLVMEYVDGTDLSSLVKQHGPLPLDQALDCILQAARGLQYAHEHGVVHRDIKPGNLLLDHAGTVKVLDMGLARLDSAGPHQDELTGSGQIMGTVDYMAPEQAVSTKHADQRADIYSLGLTLWYLLTGRPAYPGQTAVEKLMAHQTAPIPSLRDACPGVPSALEAVFTKLVAKTPEARYQTMAEVIADLERFLRNQPSVAAVRAAAVDDADSRKARFLPLAPTEPAKAPTPVIKTAPAPEVADPDVTMDMAAPQVGTDPHTEQSLPSAPAVTPNAKKPGHRPRPPWWHDGRKLAAAGAAGLVLVLLGVWVVVRDKHSPRAGTLVKGAGGEVAWNLPPGAPPPAIAPFDAAKAKEHQAAWAKFLSVETEMTNSVGMRFALIPPGEFDMGSTEAEVAGLLKEAKVTKLEQWYIDRSQSETPKHRVRVTKPFWLGVHEVTRGQFRRFVEERGYKTQAERDGKGGYGVADGEWKQDPRFVWHRDLGFEQADDSPVVNVTWNDVTAFCAWLSEKEGEKSLLPTEAQWEHACRAGTTTKWCLGDDEGALKDHAWFYSNAEKRPHGVGQKSPNAWALYDMHGNVWEWCQDWWSDRCYATSPMDDPTGASEGSDRVNRGGCWAIAAVYCRSACRHGVAPAHRSGNLGFRVVRQVPSSAP